MSKCHIPKPFGNIEPMPKKERMEFLSNVGERKYYKEMDGGRPTYFCLYLDMFGSVSEREDIDPLRYEIIDALLTGKSFSRN